MTPPDCPPRDRLAAFARGDLPAAEIDRFAAHLETCPACEAALDELEAGGTLQAAVRRAAPPDAPSPGERAGTLLAGRYRLTAEIGAGGMGCVWSAEQTEPVRRPVAVKLVKPGMDSRQVLARFAAERQALAIMDHPNIAKVFDAGATASGRPFFVMELVDGVPITDYCDGHRLTTRERLALFVPVCQAVQHAHQKGVIHRDLKPSNVLVARFDGRPVPKVIDFGVAKATGQSAADGTRVTGLGAVVGTPEYMAPEQAALDALDIDTRADVYALGVVLYELLTGSTPLTRQRLGAAALLEVLRLVREEEPPPPSARLSTADALPGIAARRGTEPKRLTAALRGDLDWVVLKALEKDRARRYETADGLARDLGRYLADEPVEAGKPTAAYRLRKFARRHRRPLAAGAAAFALLAAAAGVSTWQALRATEAEQVAVGERNDTQAALTRLEAEQARTKQALAASERALAGRDATEAFYSVRLLRAGRPKGTEGGLGKDVSLRKAIDVAVAALDTAFPGQPEVEAAVRHKLAESYLFMDEKDLALRDYQKALALRQGHLPPGHPDTLQTLNDIAVVHYHARRWAEALALHEQVLAARRAAVPPDPLKVAMSLRNVSAVDYFLGRNDAALAASEEVVRIHRAALGEFHKETLRSQNNLAAVYAKVGRRPEAVLGYEGLLAARRRLDRDPATRSDFDTHMVMSNLGRAYADSGRPADAVRLLEEVTPLQRANLDADHTDVLDTLQALATAYAGAGRPADALRVYRELAPARRRKHGPSDARTLQALGGWAEACLAAGRPADAEPLFAEQVAGARVHFRPGTPELADRLAAAGGALLAARRYAAAEPYLREALAIRAERQPGDWRAADARGRLGEALAGLRKFAAAEPLLESAYGGLKAGGGVPLEGHDARLAEAADRLAALYSAWGRPEAAARWRAERARYAPPLAPQPREVR